MAARTERTLQQGRAWAEALMRDTCLVERKDSKDRDPETLENVWLYVTVAEGKCRVKPRDTMALDRTLGEQEVLTASHEVQRPIDATRYRHGDRVTITAVDPTIGDPALVGRVLWVINDPMRSQGTKRELICSEEEPADAQ